MGVPFLTIRTNMKKQLFAAAAMSLTMNAANAQPADDYSDWIIRDTADTEFNNCIFEAIRIVYPGQLIESWSAQNGMAPSIDFFETATSTAKDRFAGMQVRVNAAAGNDSLIIEAFDQGADPLDLESSSTYTRIVADRGNVYQDVEAIPNSGSDVSKEKEDQVRQQAIDALATIRSCVVPTR
jgi:hypothetical protein